MLENLFKFKHDCNTINEGLGVTDELHVKCREIVNFSTFTSYLLKKDLYDHESEEVPPVLTTVTGILEKALTFCNSEIEKLYTIFIFKEVHENAHSALDAYGEYMKAEEKERKKLKLLIEAIELKALSEDDRNRITTPKDMFKKIEAAKNNLFNFDKYYSVLKNYEPAD